MTNKLTIKKIETLNTLSHLLGTIIGIVLLITGIIIRKQMNQFLFMGFMIYTATFTFLFLTSTLYHYANFCNSKFKRILRLLDHSAIYIFIAGSYTPFLVRIFTGTPRIISLSIIWSIAIIGVIFKITTVGNFDRLKNISVGLYILMGWLSVFMIYHIYKILGLGPVLLLALGGIVYSIGTYFYKNNKLIYHHVIWHFFVLVGALFHLASIILIIK